MSEFTSEVFSSSDLYQIYVSNEELTILDMAILTKQYPQIIYKSLKTFFARPKELRGYKEYKNFVKEQNTLCLEIYSIENEFKMLTTAIEKLIQKREQVKDLKKEKLAYYIKYMNSMKDLEDDDEEEDYDLEEN